MMCFVPSAATTGIWKKSRLTRFWLCYQVLQCCQLVLVRSHDVLPSVRKFLVFFEKKSNMSQETSKYLQITTEMVVTTKNWGASGFNFARQDFWGHWSGSSRWVCKSFNSCLAPVISFVLTGSAVTKNLLKSNYKVTTILDVDKAKCSGYPCKVASSPRQLTEEVDITITGNLKSVRWSIKSNGFWFQLCLCHHMSSRSSRATMESWRVYRPTRFGSTIPPLIMSRLKPSTIWRGTKGLDAWRPLSRAAWRHYRKGKWQFLWPENNSWRRRYLYSYSIFQVALLRYPQ